MPKKGSAHLGKQGLHQVEPGAVLGSMHIFEPVGAGGQKHPGFPGDMSRMVVQNDPDPGMRRIIGIQILEEGDEFLASMPFLDPGNDMAGREIQGGQNRGYSQSDILMIARDGGMFAGNRWPVGGRQSQRLNSRLFVQADRVDGGVAIRWSRI